ncbi:DUF1801 domain-containing protein [Paenalkalicoccus suaedae]|uniref:DUF1801 domain-containing protein n=1 Tax=Paenalkalicoccus suaedae TaxID=2592382 RepID=A0A859FAL8_9BACI|nr:DUF1801 domain-containing protein [Paenalkalicoccus suaedae]QKS69812.1 DUF1801 domain-containing protein [Paenalkalicoccus suaedae]
MSYKQKTLPHDGDVDAFIESVDSKTKKQDAYRLLDIFQEETKEPPVMWGPSMIGFGEYHYKYDSGHEGKAFQVGFSPRKAKISLYFATGDPERDELLQHFGKHTSGKSCVYINKLADVNEDILRSLIRQSVAFLTNTYPPKP